MYYNDLKNSLNLFNVGIAKGDTHMQLQSTSRFWIYVITGMLSTMVAIAFARMSYGVILPYMSDSLSLSYKQSGFLGTITSLGYLCLVLVAGIVASKWGGKKTILSGISITTISFLGLALTQNYAMTMVFMLLLGVGTAFTFTTLISTITAWFPSKRGFVIGLMTSGVGIGVLTTGFLVPYFDEVFSGIGWRYAWASFSLFGLITLTMIAIFIQNPPEPTAEESHNSTSHRTSPLKIYKNRNLILVGLIYGIVGLTYLAQSIFIMSYMLEYGIEAKVAGQLVALNGIISIFSSPIWGYISDRVGRANAIIITCSLTCLAMSVTLISQTLLGFTLHMILLSSTVSGLFTLVQASSMDHVDEPREMPIAFSYVTFYFATGQLIGPLVSGWLIEDFGGFKSAFFMLTVILAIGIVLAVVLRLNSKKKMHQKISVEETL